MAKLSGLIFIVVFVATIAHRALAYPEFIGYGYTSCATCHYNPQGSGPLNDYGRALFAGEIAARDVFDESTTDEQLGESAGFFGKKQAPWWLRPSFKYRGLFLHTNPGSSSAEQQRRFIIMQEEVNLTIPLHPEQKLLVTANLSRAERGPYTLRTLDPNDPIRYNTETWLSREHYIRWQAGKSLFLMGGMFDKIFGLRLIDHTAYKTASVPGLTNYSVTRFGLTHGIAAQWIQAGYELSGHYFIGNQFESTGDEPNKQQKGFSLMAEYNLSEKARAGGSFLSSSSNDADILRLAVHDKRAVSFGSALLSELGYFTTKNKGGSSQSETTGHYALVHTTVHLRRGYNFLNLAEYYKSESKSGSNPPVEGSDKFRVGFGLLTFPMPRTEVRLTTRNTRTWSTTTGDKDNWDIQAQLHLSL